MASPKVRYFRRMFFMLLFVLIIYGGVIGFTTVMKGKFLAVLAHMPPPTVTVSVIKAKSETWSARLQATATLEAEQGTMLTAQAPGTITGLYFKSGERVKKGTLLVQINDNVARAKLAADKASLTNARQNLERQRRLYARQATSLAALQGAEATYREAQAAVQADQATLSNLQIRAPFDGHLGLRKANLGEYVAPGSPIVDIQQWNPLRVQFQLPQGDLGRVRRGDRVTLRIDGMNGQQFSGRVTAIGAAINDSTRTFSVEAKIDNSAARLRPGMFGLVSLQLKQKRHVIAIPKIAITYNTYGDFIYIVETTPKGRIAKQINVKTGVEKGNWVAIEQGLKAGQTVVIAGQVKLYPGAHVKIVPAPKGLLNAPAGLVEN